MAAKDQYSTNLGLSILPEIDQAQYPGIYLECFRLRNALRILQSTLDTYTGALSEDSKYWDQVQPTSSSRVQNISKVYAITSESINPGNVVNFYSNSGVLTARKANATDITKPARAYCSSPSAVSSGAYGEFVLLGMCPYITGLTPGAPYYLSATAGLITATAPSGSGNAVQPIGYAINSSNLWFNPSLTIGAAL
jgi:predicted RecA/RadA family phage recombinase